MTRKNIDLILLTIDADKEKIKKQGDNLMITLIKNPDIVAAVGTLTEHRPYVEACRLYRATRWRTICWILPPKRRWAI
ncbi:hypothetical protein CE195_03155, partial [Sodalis-like symbiont of Philaenus spumarius]